MNCVGRTLVGAVIATKTSIRISNQTSPQFPATFYPQIFVPIITAAPTRYTCCTLSFNCIFPFHPRFSLYKTAKQAHGRPLIAIYRRLVLSSYFYLLLPFCGSKQSFQKSPTYSPKDFPLLAAFQQIKHLPDNSSRQRPLVIVVSLE